MSFVAFLFIGWVRIRCRNCSSRLVLRSVGDKFYLVLSAGVVLTGAMWFYFDYPYRWLGETPALILFVAVIALTLVISVYYAWRESDFQIR